MRQLIWENNPHIGFWIDNDPVRFYYGTYFAPTLIGKIGLLAPRWVSLSLDPYTALRRIGDGHILVLEIPTRWMLDHMDTRLGGNKRLQIERLLNKEMFLNWKRLAVEYYSDAQINIAKHVPARYIVGYMDHK